MTTVTAKKHADVKGKELLYLVVSNGKKEPVIINVGQKTYDAVVKLNEDEQLQPKTTTSSKLDK